MHSLRRTLAVAFAATLGAASIVLLQQVSPTDEAAARTTVHNASCYWYYNCDSNNNCEWQYIC